MRCGEFIGELGAKERRGAVKDKCPDCLQRDAIGQLPEYNHDGYCMMAFPTEFGSDTPCFVQCDKAGIVGKPLEPWYIEAFSEQRREWPKP